MEPVRWGIVGPGSIVDGTMAPGLGESPTSELVAVVSRDRQRADAFADRFGTFAYAG